MRGDSASDQVEGRVWQRKLFRFRQARFHAQASFARRLAGTIEHRLGNVAQGHVMAKAGEKEAGVSAAGGHVEHAGAFWKSDARQSSADVIDVLENVPFAIAI